MEDYVYVYLVDFGTAKVNEYVVLNEDGSYTVYLDAKASYEAQQKAYEHAMSHIRNNDFQKENVQEIEASAHNVIKMPPALPEAEKRRQEALARLKRKGKTNKRALKQIEAQRRRLEAYCEYLEADRNSFLLKRAEDRKLYGGL